MRKAQVAPLQNIGDADEYTMSSWRTYREIKRLKARGSGEVKLNLSGGTNIKELTMIESIEMSS